MRAAALMGDNPWFERQSGAVAREPVARKGSEAAEPPDAEVRLARAASVRHWWSTATVRAASPRS